VNKNELIGLGALGVVAFVLYSKARAAGTLLFRPGKVSNISFDGVAPVLDLSLVVQNTSSSGFTLESMAGNIVAVNGDDQYIIGNFSNFTPVPVNGNSETVVPVRVRLQMIGIVQNIIDAFRNGDTVRVVRLQGYVNAGFIRAPLNVEFAIGTGINRQ